MSRRDDHKTPPESPSALSRLVHEATTRPLPEREARLARYLADIDSVPPPPNVTEKLSELREADKVTQSGSWIVEGMLDEALRSRDQVHAIELMRERDLRLEAEKAAEVAEKRLALQRDWWAGLARSVLAPLIVAAVLGFFAVFFEIWRSIHGP